ncbi:H-type small acid-soluble spore protein [Anoxybacillus suryakundensis]|uniref:H-type small acid-soluble spore protein n=1 Tax=Anoxybacillus suryakundensis TaxID=1325335 RepID=UPI0006E46569|nr:H-type small acid-soluble spore protein [Anoxybacillus suryakundensis]
MRRGTGENLYFNLYRAKRIAESGEIVPVTYEGRQVLIQHVDEKNKTARIYSKENPKKEMVVLVHLLNEE